MAIMGARLRYDRPFKIHSFATIGEQTTARWWCVGEFADQAAARDWIARRAAQTPRDFWPTAKIYRLGEYEGSKLRREIARFAIERDGALRDISGRAR